MIVGLTGRSGSGKDTVGEHLHENYDFHRLAFAQQIKTAAINIFDLDYGQVYGEKKEHIDARYNKTGRQLIQELGTEVVRAIHPDVWIINLKKQFDYIMQTRRSKNTVVTDIRFPNEAEAILSWGGEVWMISGRENSNVDLSHESERLFSRIKRHREIDNSGSLEGLYHRVDGIMKELGENS